MKTCTLEGIDVAYEEFGEGRSILFLHGWSLDHTNEVADFEPIFANRPGWRRLYLDLPGHGRTPGAERVRDMDGILQVVLDRSGHGTTPQHAGFFKTLVRDWLDRVEEAENHRPAG